MIPIKINPFICGLFVGTGFYCRAGAEEYSINTVKYEYVIRLLFQAHWLLPLIAFPYVLSPVPPFSFSPIPPGTGTTNKFLPLSWQRHLPLSTTGPQNPCLDCLHPSQLDDEAAGRESTEANLFRSH